MANLFLHAVEAEVEGSFIDIVLDTLLDGLKLIPFLFIAFLIIELIEHKLSKKSEKIIAKAGKAGPLIGGLLGGIPQCGFSVVATNLYITRIISLGTLISIYLSTSDEMIPVLLSSDAPITKVLSLVGIKILIGMVVGFVIDLIVRETHKKDKKTKEDFHVCEDEHCHCEKGIITSSIIHTLKTLGFILLVTFALNIIFGYVFSEEAVESFMEAHKLLAPMLASLIGLIPNCGSSVMISSIYAEGVITFGTAMAGLLTNSGLAILVLFRQNKNMKENLKIIALIYFLGILFGYIFNLIGVAI
jgi:hypothetical protein